MQWVEMRAPWALALAAGVSFCVQMSPSAQPEVHAQAATSGELVASAAVNPAPPAAPAAVERDEPAITVPGVGGDYLRSLHVRIHWRFAHNFIELVAAPRPPTDPVNDPRLTAEVLFTVRWDGSPAEVTLSKTSGVREFDQAAVKAVRGDISFPVPPLALYGDDGVAHFRWVFARDYRLCGEGELRRREDPLELALPRLFIQGRYKEALLRVTRSMQAGDFNAMAIFARTWLARPFSDRVADANAAAALARLGDQRQISRLRPALDKADTVVVAARGLAALKYDLCDALDPALRARDPAATDVAMTALRTAGTVAPGGACLRTLATLVDDEAAPKSLRATALKTFATIDPAGAHKRSVNLLQDGAPELRAAAAFAIARPGGGRPTLYRLEPMLKDSSGEVRAAVAAALVRGCGELSFDYLQPLFKNNDTRSLVAMAPGLGELSSPASADLLAKMLKRGVPALTLAVTRALAERKDDKARALLKPLADAAKRNPYTAHDLKVLLYGAAPLDELMPLAKDPYLGIIAYKAMLRAKRHDQAAEWLVAAFDRLPPEVLGEAFGDWLADPPHAVAVQ
jgi:TonB C terminal